MSVVNMCDRCKSVDIQVIPVLGKDLCNDCVSAFKVWVDCAFAPPTRSKKKRQSPRGESLRIALQLIADRGVVTPTTYGNVARLDYRAAYFSLNNLARNGRLRRERRDGEIQFFVPTAEAAE